MSSCEPKITQQSPTKITNHFSVLQQDALVRKIAFRKSCKDVSSRPHAFACVSLNLLIEKMTYYKHYKHVAYNLNEFLNEDLNISLLKSILLNQQKNV